MRRKAKYSYLTSYGLDMVVGTHLGALLTSSII